MMLLVWYLSFVFWVNLVVRAFQLLTDLSHGSRLLSVYTDKLSTRHAANHLLKGAYIQALWILPLQYLVYQGFVLYGLPLWVFWVQLGVRVYLTVMELYRVFRHEERVSFLHPVGIQGHPQWFSAPPAAAWAVLEAFFAWQGLRILQGW